MNVLLLTDFSSTANHVMKYASILLRDKPAKITLMHVKKPCSGDSCSGKCNTIFESKLNKDLKFFKDQNNPLHQLNTHFIEGQYLDSIRDFVKRQDIDLIIVGNSHQHQIEDEIDLDKKTVDVITKVNCPVLLVSKNTSLKSPKKLLLPTDFSINVEHKVFSVLSEIYDFSEKNIDLLSVQNNRELTQIQLTTKQKINEVLSYIGIQKISENHISSAKKCASVGYDTIVMFAKNLSVFNLVFSTKKNSAKQICHNNLPMLFLHG